MKRRLFLAAATGVPLAAPALAQTAPTLNWRLTSSFPKNLDTIYGTAQIFAKYVAEATDNRFQIQTFAAGEIVPGLQALDAVSNKAVEIAQTPTYFYTGKDPVLGFGTGMPFGLNARLQQAWWQFGGGADITNEALAKFNAYALAAGNSTTQMGGFFRKEINSVDDLKGLKFRIAGMGGEVLSRLGVVPQLVAPGDIYPSLERGALDAVEFVGPYDDEKLGFYKVAKYYYYPGFWEGGAMMHLIFNRDVWNALPASYQTILRLAAEAANTWMIGKYDSQNPRALKRILANGGVLKAFPQSVMEAALAAANAYYQELAAANPAFAKALESYNGFREEGLSWWQVGEYSFDTFMVRTKGKA